MTKKGSFIGFLICARWLLCLVLISLVVLDFGGCYQCQISTQEDRVGHVYIPGNLEECFVELKKRFSTKQLEEFKNLKEEKEVIIRYDPSTGLWIRNNWGLWSGSRLAKYFNAMGIKHPDDMSSIILSSFHHYLNGLEINLAEQVRQQIRLNQELHGREMSQGSKK